MKVILLLLLFLLASVRPTAAQTDTIQVTHTANTYLLFNQPVDLVAVGLAGTYLAKIEGKSVFLKAKEANVWPTTILVRSGDDYFTAQLEYNPLPEKSLYDFRSTGNASVLPAKSKTVQPLPAATVQKRLEELSKAADGKALRTKKAGDVRLSLVSLFNDQGATYLQLLLRNGSSIPYWLDYVGFELLEQRGKRFSNNNTDRKETLPLVAVAPAQIAAGKAEALRFALPLYAFGRRGKLLITVRETAGSRVLHLKVPGQAINHAPFLKSE
ncbi:MAG: DUF4138 domain-containing protein [Cytophagales bacterium]|nr:DUF4138 domain-containing protein [Cytophagales bacterium]